MTTPREVLTDEDLAALERIAPKAVDAIRKIHGMAIARTEAERMQFVYMSIPARPEEDADCIMYRLAASAPALVAEIKRLRKALGEGPTVPLNGWVPGE